MTSMGSLRNARAAGTTAGRLLPRQRGRQTRWRLVKCHYGLATPTTGQTEKISRLDGA
jgi:hypothetical protein